jgi:talin
VQQAVVSGRYPCSQEEAIEFAALQLQITFGDHNPQTHHAGFFEYVVSNYLCFWLIV